MDIIKNQQTAAYTGNIDISDEMKVSYMSYALSVLTDRALPDVRDGLKPVHRRVLYAMHELGNRFSTAHKKSARIVGDVLGKYHPHGDNAAYDAIVRMAQSFSLRYPLVDGQGNFGSVDGDSAAAMRYTEIRMSRMTDELMADIDRDTIDMTKNYDGTEIEPSVLPSAFPNLLANGSEGIAVGMATKIPPHYLGDVVDAVIAQIKDPDISNEALADILVAPDFPTGGIICGVSGARQAYITGKGSVTVRARVHIEDNDTHTNIIFTELPYQINKARLMEQIATAIRDGDLPDVAEIRARG
jgi:DNA gyrase subunit A